MKFCNLLKFGESLPTKYQNLAKTVEGEEASRWGGGMWLADFCPSVVTMTSNC